jgi:hypothetical protein
MRVVQLERRGEAGSRKRVAESKPAAGRFTAHDARPVHFHGDFTTDGRRWTRMEGRLLSVFISVHPWFNCPGCDWPYCAKLPAFQGRANSLVERAIHNHENLYQVTGQLLAARCRAALQVACNLAFSHNMRHCVEHNLKSLALSNLQLKPAPSNQGQSRLIKVNQGQKREFFHERNWQS